MDRTCTKCHKTMNIKHFTQRGTSKKTGKPLYISHCNPCKGRSYRNNQVKTQKLDIDPKWLVRGNVSDEGGNGFTQFTQE